MKRDLASTGIRRAMESACAMALVGAVVCLGCLPAMADDPDLGDPGARLLKVPRTVDRSTDARALMTPRPAPGRAPNFYRGELLPRLASRLARHRDHTSPLVTPGGEWLEHLVWERVSDDVQRDVEKATKKALRDHLLENTKLRDVVASLERRAKGQGRRARTESTTTDPATEAGPARRARDRGVDFDLGFHRALPELEMKYSLKRGGIRLNMGVQGSVDLRYRHIALGSTEVRAGFDGDDGSYRLLASFGF